MIAKCQYRHAPEERRDVPQHTDDEIRNDHAQEIADEYYANDGMCVDNDDVPVIDSEPVFMTTSPGETFSEVSIRLCRGRRNDPATENVMCVRDVV